jgi:hypothetical protein
MKTKIRIALSLIALIVFIGILINLFRHYQEDKALSQFIKNKNLGWVAKEKSKYAADVVSDSLRTYFNIDINTWKHLNLNNRPFFRNSALELLKYREGVCGEGTRVLVRFLQKLGYDATRISIYYSTLNVNHTLVSIVIDGKEYFIDSINSDDSTHYYLKKYNINVNFLHKVDYDKRYNENADVENLEDNPGITYFRGHYVVFSYEAIPLTKIGNIFFKNIVVRNFNRPSKLVSYIAESYFLLWAITFFAIDMILLFIIWLLRTKNRNTKKSAFRKLKIFPFSSLKNDPEKNTKGKLTAIVKTQN